MTLATRTCELELGAATPQTSLIRLPIEIEIAGAVVRVQHGTEPQQLRMVLQALRA